MKTNKVKITERGWPAHYILGHRCVFHRNTLLECGDVKIVVSSVGQLMLKRHNGLEDELVEVGSGRFYETMVFYAKEDKWHDADSTKEVATYVPDVKDPYDEIPANSFHDAIVAKYVEKLKKGAKIPILKF